jgi:hypothetical protein
MIRGKMVPNVPRTKYAEMEQAGMKYLRLKNDDKKEEYQDEASDCHSGSCVLHAKSTL